MNDKVKTNNCEENATKITNTTRKTDLKKHISLKTKNRQFCFKNKFNV